MKKQLALQSSELFKDAHAVAVDPDRYSPYDFVQDLSYLFMKIAYKNLVGQLRHDDDPESNHSISEGQLRDQTVAEMEEFAEYIRENAHKMVMNIDDIKSALGRINLSLLTESAERVESPTPQSLEELAGWLESKGWYVEDGWYADKKFGSDTWAINFNDSAITISRYPKFGVEAERSTMDFNVSGGYKDRIRVLMKAVEQIETTPRSQSVIFDDYYWDTQYFDI